MPAASANTITRLDNFLAYAESNRTSIFFLSAALIAFIAWIDVQLPTTSVGFLYLLPVLLTAPALHKLQILGMAALCGYLRETFDPLQDYSDLAGYRLLAAFDPTRWAPGSAGRLVVAVSGFAMTGFFISELNQRRRLLMDHLAEREEQIRLRHEAERQLRILIDTSPLAILTLDGAGRVAARQRIGADNCLASTPASRSRAKRSTVPADPQPHAAQPPLRRATCAPTWNAGAIGEMATSSWPTSGSPPTGRREGPGLAAVVWDASENLRDREGAGLDSMMATSRVLIGAISHEIRNLASAAAASYTALAAAPSGQLDRNEHYQVLGTLIHGLEKIASSGLRMAADREAAVADLGTVLDETRIVIEPALREAGIRSVWEISPGLPLVQADHHSLLQAFVNLARNSQQALRRVRAARDAHRRHCESDLVVVRFRDTGPGVAHPEELFRPFQPGAHSMGLGLYISRAILRSHGGGLRYEPQATGSCFAVELWPAENVVEADDGTIAKTHSRAAGGRPRVVSRERGAALAADARARHRSIAAAFARRWRFWRNASSTWCCWITTWAANELRSFFPPRARPDSMAACWW